MPESVFIGLLDETGTEIQDSGYSRQQSKFLVVGRSCYTLETVTFGPFQDPHTVSSIAFFNGDMILHKIKLADLRHVASSESISFQAGSIEFLVP